LRKRSQGLDRLWPLREKGLTALIVIDPFNDFISEGGKVGDRLKGVAEANHCVRNMLSVLNAARNAGLINFGFTGFLQRTGNSCIPQEASLPTTNAATR
jgi:hypothetical protein